VIDFEKGCNKNDAIFGKDGIVQWNPVSVRLVKPNAATHRRVGSANPGISIN